MAAGVGPCHFQHNDFHFADFAADVGNIPHEREFGCDRGVGGKNRIEINLLSAGEGMDTPPVHEADSLHLALQHLGGQGHVAGNIDGAKASHHGENRSAQSESHDERGHHYLNDGEPFLFLTAGPKGR